MLNAIHRLGNLTGELKMSITKVKTKNHEEWLELRSKYIGGSDAAAVVGMNAFSSPYSLWAEKTGKMAGFSGNLATDVGTFLEEFIAQRFATVSGKKVRNCNQSFFNSKYPYAIANIDREVVGEDSGLECKSTSALSASRFKDSDLPANYYCQCVHYLAVTEKKRWYVAVLIGNSDFKIYLLTRYANDTCPEWCEAMFHITDEEIEALMTEEANFWDNVVQDTPPEVDGFKATTDTISTIYAESDDGSSVDLMAYKKDLADYIEIGQQIKRLEALQTEKANRIKAFMGDSAGGICDGFKVSWKSADRKTFDAKRFASENPHIDLTKYYNKSSYRTFRVTEN